jgi:2-oxoglutarate ferredoxin oxidoreductase subunit alpha
MGEVQLMKGNETLAEAALRAGCEGYFGYPITPQSEIPEYLSAEMPKRGKVFLQAESEVASINMLYGAAGAGFKAMTTSSSPGISLMLEGISYIAAAELPCVVANVVRGGPGLGTIQPSQCDYFQAVKGGGHGDYRMPVLAPSTVQEIADLTYLSFDLAWKYRTPVMLMLDGALGQMMEKVEFKPYTEPPRDLSWCTRGKPLNGERRVITSLHIQPELMEKVNHKLQAKYREIEKNETRYDAYNIDDAEVAIVAFGLSARIGSKVMNMMRAKGHKVGLVKPITLWPYPTKVISDLSRKVKGLYVLELNAGQMIEDVRLAVEGRTRIGSYNRMGGMIFSPEEIVEHFEPFCKELGC